jgi:hypothetical protein
LTRAALRFVAERFTLSPILDPAFAHKDPGLAYTNRLLSLPISRKRLLIAPRPSNAVARLLAPALAFNTARLV